MGAAKKPVDPLVITPALVEMPVQDSKAAKLQRLYDSWFRCQRCLLGRVRTNDDIVFAHGNPDSDIMIIGEAPGEDEERTLTPFVGQSGRLLNRILAMNASDPTILNLSKTFEKGRRTQADADKFFEQIIEWRKDNFFLTNVISCRPPENRTPTKEELEKCWERVWNMIYIVDPLVIIAVGKTAAMTVLQKGKFNILTQRGEIFDVRYHGVVGEVRYPIVPVLHPSYILRAADWTSDSSPWLQSLKDWKKALFLLDYQRLQHYNIPVPLRGW